MARRSTRGLVVDDHQPLRAAVPAGEVRGTLSARELEVLRRIALDPTNHEIARQLAISTNTVRTHVACRPEGGSTDAR